MGGVFEGYPSTLAGLSLFVLANAAFWTVAVGLVVKAIGAAAVNLL